MSSLAKIYKEISQLRIQEKKALLKRITRDIMSEDGGKKHSITEIKGLGLDIWQTIDVDAYIESERDSWT